MAPEVFRLFHSIGVPLRNISTEIGLLTLHQGERYDLETVGHWLKAHPDAGEALKWKVSDEGELLVRGGTSFQGYYNRPDSLAQRVEDGWYRTGDAVSVTGRSELCFWNASTICGDYGRVNVSRRNSSRRACASVRSSRTS
jgi:long-chain acyl-CoA synthetase